MVTTPVFTLRKDAIVEDQSCIQAKMIGKLKSVQRLGIATVNDVTFLDGSVVHVRTHD